MKTLCLYMLLLCVSCNIQSQNDRFTDFSQLQNKSVILYDISLIFENNKKFALTMVDGKLKPFKTLEELTGGDNYLKLYCVEEISFKKKLYYRFIDSKTHKEVYILGNSAKNPFINNFRNITYWEEYLKSNISSHAYYYNEGNFTRLTDHYKKITWHNVKIPTESIHYSPIFYYSLDGSKIQQSVNHDIFANSPKFKSENDYRRAYTEQCRLDSIEEVRNQELDKRPIRGIINTQEDEKWLLRLYEPDTICIYYADQDSVYGWCKGKHRLLEISEIDWLHDDETVEWLKKRKLKNIKNRCSYAYYYDEDYTNRYTIRITELIAQIYAKQQEENRKEELISKHKLFLEDQHIIEGEYENSFGISFRFHNCFNKTVKKVVMTIVLYNYDGYMISNADGKRNFTFTVNGELLPECSSSVEFDDAFPSSIKRILSRAEISKITFTFYDNTTTTFTGVSNINKHRYSAFDLEP